MDEYYEMVTQTINEVTEKWEVKDQITEDIDQAIREIIYNFIEASAFDSELQKFGFVNIAKIRYQESLCG